MEKVHHLVFLDYRMEKQADTHRRYLTNSGVGVDYINASPYFNMQPSGTKTTNFILRMKMWSYGSKNAAALTVRLRRM